MSERGSFITEYIYCARCLDAAQQVLLGNEKYFSSRQLPSWVGADETLPIIAGKIGGLYAGEELHTFEYEYAPRLAPLICHPIRIAVLAEQGEQVFTVQPTTT